MKRCALLVVGVMVVVSGCMSSGPPPEAILAGDWQLTTIADFGITDQFLTFNENGKMIRSRLKLGGLTIDTDLVNGKTEVQNTSVLIDSTFLGNGLIFRGTLSPDGNEIDGTLTAQISVAFGLVKVSFNDQTAKLVRQP